MKILRLSAVGSHLPSQFRLVNKNTTGANSKVEAGISAASSRKTSSMISCSTSSVERTSSEFIYKTARNNSLSPVRRKPIRPRQRWSLPRSWRYSAPAPMPGLSDSPSNMIAKTMYRRELFCGDTWFTSQKSFVVRSALLEASAASG